MLTVKKNAHMKVKKKFLFALNFLLCPAGFKSCSACLTTHILYIHLQQDPYNMLFIGRNGICFGIEQDVRVVKCEFRSPVLQILQGQSRRVRPRVRFGLTVGMETPRGLCMAVFLLL